MAGVRSNPHPNGKYHAWFIDMTGRRRFFMGTTIRTETLRIAQRLEDEHRQIRLGYREPPKSSAKHKTRPFKEVVEEYIAWGQSQGGRGGRPWGKEHERKRKYLLQWWEDSLSLETLADLDEVLPRVEEALRKKQKAGSSGKTLHSYAQALKGFCNWCVDRGYLSDNPVARLEGFDRTPRTIRRAMSRDEIIKLMKIVPDERRLLYALAFTTGLRAGELRALKVADLNHDFKALNLRAEWTKNRKPGIQPLPTMLYEALAEFTEGKDPDAPLLKVPKDTATMMDKDLEAAEIPKWTPQGKIDFHACRVAYVTFVIESGATVKEAQALARHSTPNLTMNTYARTSQKRLCEVTEAVGKILASDLESAKCVQQALASLGQDRIKSSDNISLERVSSQKFWAFESPSSHHLKMKMPAIRLTLFSEQDP
jgi:integrase